MRLSLRFLKQQFFKNRDFVFEDRKFDRKLLLKTVFPAFFGLIAFSGFIQYALRKMFTYL